jgi:hypothetical protein
MATARSPQNGITKAVANQTARLINPSEQAALSSPADEIIRHAIEQGLQTLLQTLRTTPGSQAEIPALQRQLIQIDAPRSGFNIAVPHPLPIGDSFVLPVTPDVRWEVLNEDGEPLSPGDGFSVDPPSMDSLREQLLFFPQVVKDEPDAPLEVTFKVRASLSLTATHPATGEEITVPAEGYVLLPPVTITVPITLRIPSILAFFRHASFAPQAGNKQGFALVFVPPGSSVVSLEDLAGKGALGMLIQEVGALRTAIETLPVFEQSLLATLAGNLEGFIDGLSSLISSLARFGPPPAPPIAIRLEKSNGNLNIGELVPGFLNDTSSESENKIGSLIFIGLGETVRVYSGTKFHVGQAILQIETGAQMCAVIDCFDTEIPTANIGDSTITTPELANFSDLRVRRPDTFDNAIASFHLGKNTPL